MKVTFVDTGVLVAAAAAVGADELVTTEKPSRSIHLAQFVKVTTIHPEGD